MRPEAPRHGSGATPGDRAEGSGAPRVRPARPGEAERLAALLARAFRDDPFHRWLFPREADLERASARSFAVLIARSLREGAVYTTEACEGAAVWQPPAPALARRARQLGLALVMLPLLRARVLVAAKAAPLAALRPRAAHWYLAALGTEPARQRRGVGGALLAPVLARCDAEGLPAYLEASRAENVSFYERHGFELVGEFQVAGGPTLWRMQRAPRR
jgi:GNAT superfamily N-acetyltransferase